jgi:hypothetical protein
VLWRWMAGKPSQGFGLHDVGCEAHTATLAQRWAQ